ncbi:uncharacterized protein LY89DRAFT_716885 [Mollisia scopiformis]|uniref:ER-bound oxygenase mpaB/mpaB'/Rubber oxygenase catalytic domain-containing protein n=1 Tax=Mollisia scopiformis TaxID=149040 RepID=A0A194XGU4_MOLSC|nr:uncharacterized protein LY89DRAFT_716885 [Mollisia scopiformis]KUJ19361.1 hypothetical protein LY89DRAFT_716885 [Mollisia scopiformis]
MADNNEGPVILVRSERGDVENQAAEEIWGYAFIPTQQHLPAAEMRKMKMEFDGLAAAVVRKLRTFSREFDKQVGDKTTTNKGDQTVTWSIFGNSQINPYGLLTRHCNKDEILSKLRAEIMTIPEWVDWSQLERGQKASPGLEQVFARIDHVQPSIFQIRILDTVAWIIQVTNSITNLTSPENTIRLRLLQAIISFRILHRSATDQGYWPVTRYGYPFNHFDTIHMLNNLFCLPIWDSFRSIGIRPSENEVKDYVAFVRYLAYLMGAPDEHFDSPERAKTTFESMLIYETNIYAMSQVRAHKYLAWLEEVTPFSRGFLLAGCRAMNGNRVCDALGLPPASFFHRKAFRGLCVSVKIMVRLQKLSPALDRHIIKVARTKLWGGIKDHWGSHPSADMQTVPRDLVADVLPELEAHLDLASIRPKKKKAGWELVLFGVWVAWVFLCALPVVLVLGGFGVGFAVWAGKSGVGGAGGEGDGAPF